MLVFLVPAGAVDGGAEAHPAAQAVLVGDVVGVFLQLGARREQPRPVRVGFERVRVGDRGDVDGQARIPIHMPGAAEIVLAFQDDEITQAEPVQLDTCPHSAETRTDNDRIEPRRHVEPPAF